MKPHNKIQENNVEDKLKKLRENINMRIAFMPIFLENIKLDTKLIRAKYDALISEKFTVEQALKLCRDK